MVASQDRQHGKCLHKFSADSLHCQINGNGVGIHLPKSVENVYRDEYELAKRIEVIRDARQELQGFENFMKNEYLS